MHSAEQSVYQLGSALYLNITNRCPNRCTFCLRSSSDEIGGVNLWLKEEPSPEEVLAEAKRKLQAIEEPIKEWVFCGYGEPLERLDAAIAIMDGLKEYGLPIRINTNGLANLIHGRDVVPDLLGRADLVSVSLNAHTPELYDSLCQSVYGLKALPAVLDFLASCTKHGLAAVATVVDGPDVQVEECRKLAEGCGVAFRVREYLPQGYQ